MWAASGKGMSRGRRLSTMWEDGEGLAQRNRWLQPLKRAGVRCTLPLLKTLQAMGLEE